MNKITFSPDFLHISSDFYKIPSGTAKKYLIPYELRSDCPSESTTCNAHINFPMRVQNIIRDRTKICIREGHTFRIGVNRITF